MVNNESDNEAFPSHAMAEIDGPDDGTRRYLYSADAIAAANASIDVRHTVRIPVRGTRLELRHGMMDVVHSIAASSPCDISVDVSITLMGMTMTDCVDRRGKTFTVAPVGVRHHCFHAADRVDLDAFPVSAMLHPHQDPLLLTFSTEIDHVDVVCDTLSLVARGDIDRFYRSINLPGLVVRLDGGMLVEHV